MRTAGPALLGYVVVLCAGCTAVAPEDPLDAGTEEPADGGPQGITQLENGTWVLAGTEACSGNFGTTCVSLPATSWMTLEPMPSSGVSLRGEIGDAGPGAATLSYDGGQALIRWPSVAGYEFAAPQVGDQVRVDVYMVLLNGDPVFLRTQASTADGRLLVAAADNRIFSHDRDAGGAVCSSWSEEPECCCAGWQAGAIAVDADTPVSLHACEDAVVELDGRPFYVSVWSADFNFAGPCTEHVADSLVSAGGFALAK
jgi:hypothetical protein